MNKKTGKNMQKSREGIVRKAKSFSLVVLGTLILSFGAAIFQIPFELVTGGVSGLGIVLANIIPFEFATVDLVITVLTWSLFFIGLIVLGRDFALKTLVSTIIYPIGVSLFLMLTKSDFMGGFFNMTVNTHSELSLILSALFGGALVGIGCAVSFLGGGSTGGVDIIAFIICKIFRRLKSSVVIFAIDAGIILLGMFIIEDIVLTLLGILSAFIAAVMIDRVLLGGRGAFVAEIISESYSEISSAVISELDRTTTIIDAVGGYSGKSYKMVKVSFTIREYAGLLNIINRFDKNAFINIHRAHEINGEGWTR